jgi:hypothetical protein
MATGRKKRKDALRPSEEAHRQVVDLLELGERSSNPDIRAAAIEIAKNTSVNQRVQSARVRPATIMVASTLVLLGAIAACWYALVHYPVALGRSISGIIILVAVLLIALYALLSGHLSQDNFMKLCIAAWEWGKGLFPSSSRTPVERLPVTAGTEHSPTGDDPPSRP